MATGWDGVRDRILDRIQVLYGEVSTSSVRKLADGARVEYSTLARFLHFYSDTRYKTSRLHTRTLDRIAVALKVHPSWLREGQGSQQMSLWPFVVAQKEELLELDPVTELLRVLHHLRSRDRDESLQICRAGVAAMLAAGAERGAVLPIPFYQLLMKLDATRDAA